MTPYKKAIDAFTESEEWQISTDPKTIGASERQRVYIENRMHRAFHAGWNAREAINEQRLTGKTGKPTAKTIGEP